MKDLLAGIRVLPARVHYSDMVRIYNQVIRDKDPGESRGIQVQGYLMLPPFPEGSPRASSSPSTEDAAARVGCFYPGKPTKDTAPKGFTGAGGRHPLPGIYQDSRLA